MKCPKCGSTSSIVLDSRIIFGNRVRKRKCKKCGEIFFTKEITMGTKKITTYSKKFQKEG